MPAEKVSPWLTDNWTGGLSEGSKRGIKGSYRAGIGLDYRTDPDVVSALRKLKKDSDATVDGLVLWIVEAGTDLYMLADNGDLYKRTNAGTYSLINNFSDCNGEGLALFDDYIFVAGATSLHRYGPLSGTPVVEEDFLKSPDTEIDQFSGVVAGANTYTLPTSISETATNKLPFTPTADNITGVTLQIVAKGTGDWTITVHDNSDNLVGAVTVANGSLPSAGVYRFILTGIPDITAGNSYHIHATSSVADGTVRTSTSADFSTAEYATLQFYTTEDVDQSSDLTESSTATPEYTLLTAIDENDANRREFVPEKNGIVGVSLLISDVGTGNWTVTVHDDTDAEIATDTITNANLEERKGYVKFEFTVADLVPTATYHIHVTSTVADGKVYTATTSNFSAAYFRTHYPILYDAVWHPMKFFPSAGKLAIGNGNFLAEYDNILYREQGIGTGSERLQFAKEEQARALELVGDYLCTGIWKGDDIGDHGQGRLYFWDGNATTYNAFKDTPGEVNALLTADDGLMYAWIGGQGDIYVYSGGLTIAQTIKSVEKNKTIEIYPGAVANWLSIPRFGISDGSDTGSTPRVVYSYGAKSKNYSRSLGSDYPVSEGVTDDDMQIGAMIGIGPSKFFVSWKDSSGSPDYGVDIIDVDNDQTGVTHESLIFDNESPHERRVTYAWRILFEALEAGQSIDFAYKIDREASWDTSLGSVSFAVDGDINFVALAIKERFTELELRITLNTTGANAPTVLGSALFFKTELDVLDKP